MYKQHSDWELVSVADNGGVTNLKVWEGGGVINTVKTLKFKKGGVHDPPPPPAPMVAPPLVAEE